jgi:DNA-binding transcriptional LysR family regulator
MLYACMKINHRQIEAFQAIMQAGSVSDAALRMGISQPAASRLLRDLQHNLSLELFERSGNRLNPTPAAYTLYSEVERSFTGLQRIAAVADNLREKRARQLRVAAMPALSNDFLPRFTGAFLQAREDLHVTLHGVITPVIMDWMVNNQCDLGFIESSTPTFSLRTVKIPAVPRVAVLYPGHRLAAKPVVHITDFEGEDFIALPPDSVGMRQIGVVTKAHGVSLRPRADSPLTEIVCGMVASGLGISISDPYTARARARASGDLVVRPLLPAIPFSFTAVLPSNDVPLPSARDFIAGVIKEVIAIRDAENLEVQKSQPEDPSSVRTR